MNDKIFNLLISFLSKLWPIILCVIFVFFKISSDDRYKYENWGNSNVSENFQEAFSTKENDINTENSTSKNFKYEWSFVTSKMERKNISLEIKLLEEEINSAYRLLLDIDNMSLEQLGVTADYNTESSKYRTEYFIGIYKKLYSHDSKVFDFIAQLLKNIASEENLSRIDTINLITSMVQKIQYQIPTLTRTQVLSPTLCIDYRYGDCDTKTLLLVLLLRKMGVDCIHFDSEIYSHAMIGINIPSTGEYIEYQGTKYFFLETTYPGWNLGILPPQYKNKNFWNVWYY